MTALLLSLSLGFAVSAEKYSVMDSMLANQLLKHGFNYDQQVLENLTKAQPNVIYALQDQAIALEAMRETERLWYFVKVQEITSDIRIMSIRYQRIKDGPSLDELWRLPTIDACDSCLEFNRAYAKTLDEHKRWNTVDAATLDEYILENKKYAEVWDNLKISQNPAWGKFQQRLALATVVKLIGEEDFYAGKLPPAVPLWQFVEVK